MYILFINLYFVFISKIIYGKNGFTEKSKILAG